MERRIALAAALAAFSLSAVPAGAQVPGVPPAASDCQVTTLDSDSVRVTGAVDPNALATSYRVEYGLLGVLNLSSPTIAVGSAPDATAVLTQLDGLVPDATYSCRIVALNAAGETAGSTTTFLFARDGASGPEGSEGLDGSSGLDGSDTRDGSNGSGGTSLVNPATGQLVAAGTPGAVSCTLTGTAGSDRLKGTKRSDVICGLGGADRIRGLAGKDIVIGGPGDDSLRGDGGKDRLLGNGGEDRLLGGRRGDSLSGGRGGDFLFGWKGRDRMLGGRGNDRFVANRDRRGGDRLNGGKGRDRANRNGGDRTRSIERHRVTRR